jgi:hypothetical protein
VEACVSEEIPEESAAKPVKKKAAKRKTRKKAERKDPPSRSLAGRDAMFRVQNQDDSRAYRWVAKDDASLTMYEALGYEPETWRKKGPTLSGRKSQAAAASDGSVMERGGCVLMSISKDDEAWIKQNGAFGSGGQKRADQIERRILDRKGADMMRGIGGPRHFEYENSTTPAEQLG